MYIKVQVHAGAKKELLTKKADDAFDIAVKEPAEKNRANKRVQELLSGYYGIAPKQVRFVSGHHTPSKILSVPDDVS